MTLLPTLLPTDINNETGKSLETLAGYGGR